MSAEHLVCDYCGGQAKRIFMAGAPRRRVYACNAHSKEAAEVVIKNKLRVEEAPEQPTFAKRG